MAAALAGAGCRHFFVAHLSEALAIRAIVPDDALLAVLNGLLPGQAAAFAEHRVTPVLGSLAELDVWSAQARQRGGRLPALLHVDTGMARLGFDAPELAALGGDPGRLAGWRCGT